MPTPSYERGKTPRATEFIKKTLAEISSAGFCIAELGAISDGLLNAYLKYGEKAGLMLLRFVEDTVPERRLDKNGRPIPLDSQSQTLIPSFSGSRASSDDPT